jgi:WD40 repeat protein
LNSRISIGQSLISQISDRIDVWNAANGQHRHTFSHKGISSISPDGQLIAVGNPRTPITLYRASDGTMFQELEIKGYPRFIPNSQLLAISNSTSYKSKYVKGVILYRLEDERLLGYLPTTKEPDYNF